MFSSKKQKLVLPTCPAEDVYRHRAEFEQANKHSRDSRDALIRLIWAQVHSTDPKHNQDGVKAATQLFKLQPDEERQMLYLAAVGQYNLGQYIDARKHLKQLLETWPDFSQAETLLAAIDESLMNDTLVAGGALAAIGGVAAVVVGALLAKR
eukprot:TRINITY_DN18595_c0_g1_i1.p2 TRINITY_DN18595_c0_g1~~TRINITY_DN18595_c0_g1_i1.p2  ORF type:complete len:152 (-),score=20.97 TRINITY_DN18595_c0_g1_i1:349-804(-)